MVSLFSTDAAILSAIVDIFNGFPLERVNKEFLCHTAELINVFIQEQILEILSASIQSIYATHVC